MSVMPPNYPIRFAFAPDIVMWRVVAARRRKSMTGTGHFPCGLRPRRRCRAVRRGPPRLQAKGAFRRHIGTLVNGLLGAGKQALAASHRRAPTLRNPEMPSTTDTDSIVLGVAAFLFAFALIAPHRLGVQDLRAHRAERYGPACAGATDGSAWWRRHRSMDTASSSSSAATRWSI